MRLTISLATTKEALRLARLAGHEVGGFSREGRWFVARCECGARLLAKDGRFLGQQIMGDAVYSTCLLGKEGASEPYA